MTKFAEPLKLKETIYSSSGDCVIMESTVDPDIDQDTRREMDQDRADLIRMYELGAKRPTRSEDAKELIDEAINLDDLCYLLGVKFLIKHTDHYHIEIGSYIDETGWLIAFSASHEAKIIYIKRAQITYEREIEILPPQVVHVSLDCHFDDKEESLWNS